MTQKLSSQDTDPLASCVVPGITPRIYRLSAAYATIEHTSVAKASRVRGVVDDADGHDPEEMPKPKTQRYDSNDDPYAPRETMVTIVVGHRPYYYPPQQHADSADRKPKKQKLSNDPLLNECSF